MNSSGDDQLRISFGLCASVRASDCASDLPQTSAPASDFSHQSHNEEFCASDFLSPASVRHQSAHQICRRHSYRHQFSIHGFFSFVSLLAVWTRPPTHKVSFAIFCCMFSGATQRCRKLKHVSGCKKSDAGPNVSNKTDAQRPSLRNQGCLDVKNLMPG